MPILYESFGLSRAERRRLDEHHDIAEHGLPSEASSADPHPSLARLPRAPAE